MGCILIFSNSDWQSSPWVFMKNELKQRLVISVVLSLLALTASCSKATSCSDSKPAASAVGDQVASPRKEIIAQNVLAAQLAAHHEFEARTNFASTEAIPACLYLTESPYLEPRRISAFLICEEVVIEEASIFVSAAEKRQAFDFRFIKTPRPLGAYQIKFVEIARSNGKPVLIARLFLKVE
jgi:hypothetical protein